MQTKIGIVINLFLLERKIYPDNVVVVSIGFTPTRPLRTMTSGVIASVNFATKPFIATGGLGGICTHISIRIAAFEVAAFADFATRPMVSSFWWSMQWLQLRCLVFKTNASALGLMDHNINGTTIR